MTVSVPQRRRGILPTVLLLATAALLGGTRHAAAQTTQEIVDEIDASSYRHYLEDLLYTHPGDNRGFGPEHDMARVNIFETLASFGLTVSLDPFAYSSATYYNVVAVKTGTVTPDRQYIIGAHFDSVDNPGADDNGSGTAGVMEIARVLSGYEFESTIIFIAFDREEQGLIGSRAYVDEHQADVRAMISMDMIAYNTGAGTADIHGRSASGPLKQALAQAVSTYSGGLTAVDRGELDASDHAPFEWAGYEACLFIEDWGNPFYHSPNDHVEMPGYLDYDYATMMCRSVTGWLVEAAGLVVTLACPADLDGNGTVGFPDMLAVLTAWGLCEECPEDIDGDGEVGFSDLLVVLTNWGPCPGG